MIAIDLFQVGINDWTALFIWWLSLRWSLIAGRLPGRTDNEIKNYWNSHLSNKINQKKRQSGASAREDCKARKRLVENAKEEVREENTSTGGEDSNISFDVDEFFDFSNEDPLNLEWMNRFLEVDEGFNWNFMETQAFVSISKIMNLIQSMLICKT